MRFIDEKGNICKLKEDSYLAIRKTISDDEYVIYDDMFFVVYDINSSLESTQITKEVYDSLSKSGVRNEINNECPIYFIKCVDEKIRQVNKRDITIIIAELIDKDYNETTPKYVYFCHSNQWNKEFQISYDVFSQLEKISFEIKKEQ